MTLVEDLQALDVSIIVDAKAEISIAVDLDVVQDLVGDGALQTVLGELGTALESARNGFDDPSVLLQPLLSVLAELPTALGLDDLPIADYVEAVSVGAEVLAALLAGLDGDLAPASELLAEAGGPIGDFTATTIGEVGRFRSIVDRVESGFPEDPSDLAQMAVELLMPFPTGALNDVRAQLDELLRGVAAVELRPGALSGLTSSLIGIQVAAEAGDSAAVEQRLQGLDGLVEGAVTSLGNDLRLTAQALDGLRIDLGINAMAATSDLIRSAERDAIQFLAGIRELIVAMRLRVAELSTTEVVDSIVGLLDTVEAEARGRFDEAMDAQIERLAIWLRNLLAELGLVELRGKVSAAIHDAAAAVVDAEIDAVANDIRQVIQPLNDLVAGDGLRRIVDDAKQEMVDALSAVFDEIETALGSITTRIDELATEADAVLQRGVTALRTFRVALDEIQVAIENLGILELTEQTVANLQELREAAVELVSVVPLPDQLEPVIDQLIASIESVDLDAVIGDPLRAAAAQLEIPDELGADIEEALASVAEVVSSLIPLEVIADLEAAMDAMIESVGQLDLAPLTSGLNELLDDAASFFDDIDVTAAIEPASEAFGQVIALLDRAHPRVLLAPVINAYDSLLGQTPVPDVDTIGRRVAQVVGTAGEAAARGAAAPIQQLAPDGADLAPSTPAGEEPGSAPGPAEPVDIDARPGDLIRVLGFFPAKLHEAMAELGDGQLGDVLNRIDRLCGGLAADLRIVEDRLADVGQRVFGELDQQLRPLGDAQVGAQLAVRANLETAAGGLDVDASVALIAMASPAAIRRRLSAEIGLVETQVGDAMGQVSGAAGAAIDRMAGQLEGCALNGLTGDAENFLSALDVEPVAVEVDEFVVDMLARAPELWEGSAEVFQDIERRIRALVQEFNPGNQAMRLLVLLDVFREQLDLLNPGRLADELAEVHRAIKSGVLAYDPALLAAELNGLIEATALAIRRLDPATLIGDLTAVQDQLARLPDLIPTEALAGVGANLETIGEELAAIDVQGLLEAVESLAPEVVEAIATSIVALQSEIVALLEGVRYAQSSGQASASLTVGVG